MQLSEIGQAGGSFSVAQKQKRMDGMEGGLRKKYGLFTAISMVVGIVIGSGVFLKAEKVLK